MKEQPFQDCLRQAFLVGSVVRPEALENERGREAFSVPARVNGLCPRLIEFGEIEYL